MIRILYFASLREKFGTSGESLELPSGVSDVGGVLATLAARGGEWAIELGKTYRFNHRLATSRFARISHLARVLRQIFMVTKRGATRLDSGAIALGKMSFPALASKAAIRL